MVTRDPQRPVALGRVHTVHHHRLIDKTATGRGSSDVPDVLERVHHWFGVNGYNALVKRRTLRARRPRHFFRNPGPMPETVTLELSIPPELGPEREVIDELCARVAVIERAVAAERQRTGARVLGRHSVLSQSWKDSPTSVEPRRTLRPRFAGAGAARVTALLAYREFLADYRDARSRWLNGLAAVFPFGTYWLARFAAVPVAAPA